jgi:hypothetical protein
MQLQLQPSRLAKNCCWLAPTEAASNHCDQEWDIVDNAMADHVESMLMFLDSYLPNAECCLIICRNRVYVTDFTMMMRAEVVRSKLIHSINSSQLDSLPAVLNCPFCCSSRKIGIKPSPTTIRAYKVAMACTNTSNCGK